MAAPEVMKYFDPLLKTELIVDASPVGLGAILAQVTHDQGRNVVAYASRSLTDCESRYSQTEREALAVVWGTEHFHLYLHGSSFQAITDHKPLETIFNKSTCKATARLERLQLRLQPYKITVVYRPGADNPADYMSRHPDPKHSTSPNHLSRVDSYVNFVTANAVPNAVTLQEIQDATAKDHTLQNLAKVIATQRWYEAGRDVCEYQQVKQELTVANGVILRGTRIIVPETLRQRMIMLAHSGHQGIVKTKRLLRDSVWFPGIDGMVEEMIKQCLPCQAANHNSSPACEPLKMSPLPQGPWQELSIDFCGPFPNGDYLLVVVDDFSRFPEVEILRSTSAKAVIPHLDSIFARQGIPDVVRTDNGPPFNSENFQMFATHLGFNHRKITPIWPRANGEAERLMRTLEKAIRTAVIEHKSWRQELFTFLRQYRATPHSTTGKSPSELLNGRKLKSTMPRLQQDQASPEVRQNDAKRKEQMKEYADRHNHARASDLKVGDKVLVKQQKKNKLSTPFKPEPLEVKEKKGSMITAHNAEYTVTRNTSFFKKIPSSTQVPLPLSDEEEELHPNNETDETSMKPHGTVLTIKQGKNSFCLGDQIDFICSAVAIPTAEYSLYNSNQQLVCSKKSNEICAVKLEVRGKLLDKPKVDGNIYQLLDDKKQTAIFKVTVKGYPLVRLTCSAALHGRGGDVSITTVSQSSYEVVFHVSISAKLDGEYYCHARNSAGLTLRVVLQVYKKIPPKAIEASLNLTNIAWTDDLKELKLVFYRDEYVKSIHILAFEKGPGSVVVKFVLEIIANVDDPLRPLKNALDDNHGELSGFKIDRQIIKYKNGGNKGNVDSKTVSKCSTCVPTALMTALHIAALLYCVA
ncbi:hypothetical protein QZH41_007748 [Actinostola sp. cb2023]|nr:hypothetical protein QZH41_007748 [Actinostola sp. cb2023]